MSRRDVRMDRRVGPFDHYMNIADVSSLFFSNSNTKMNTAANSECRTVVGAHLAVRHPRLVTHLPNHSNNLLTSHPLHILYPVYPVLLPLETQSTYPRRTYCHILVRTLDLIRHLTPHMVQGPRHKSCHLVRRLQNGSLHLRLYHHLTIPPGRIRLPVVEITIPCTTGCINCRLRRRAQL
jgi:hypothetical protein